MLKIGQVYRGNAQVSQLHAGTIFEIIRLSKTDVQIKGIFGQPYVKRSMIQEWISKGEFTLIPQNEIDAIKAQ